MNWSVGSVTEVSSCFEVDTAPSEKTFPPRKLSYADAVGYEFIERKPLRIQNIFHLVDLSDLFAEAPHTERLPTTKLNPKDANIK